jgi:predicted nucleic acid-binding protein
MSRRNNNGGGGRSLYQVVVGTNVLLAALRSRRGASYRLLSLLGDGRWQMNLEVVTPQEFLRKLGEIL